MHRTILVFAAILISMQTISCGGTPSHTDAWLSIKYRPGCGNYQSCTDLYDANEADNYYKNIGAIDASNNKMTFAQWQQQYGFNSNQHIVTAAYANLGDLQFGRNMNCVQNTQNGFIQNIACYVTNYGVAPGQTLCLQTDSWENCTQSVTWPDPTFAAQSAASQYFLYQLATVAMVFTPNTGKLNNADNVTFYIFDPPDFNGDMLLDEAVGLDEEGRKNVPRMCMACHGGTYDPTTHSVTGASFLPFDVFRFQYGTDVGYSFDEQQEKLRQLNMLVAFTIPNGPILDLINGMYPGGFYTPGTPAVDGYVPPGWSSNPTLYTGVVRQYCRMCHLASTVVSFTNASDFSAPLVQQYVCGAPNNPQLSHDMPHAEIPYGDPNHGGLGSPRWAAAFWADKIAQRDLSAFMKSQNISGCP